MAKSLKQRRISALLWKKLTLTDAQALKNYSYKTGGGAKHLPFRKGLQIDVFIDSSYRTSDPESFPEYSVPIASPNDVTKTIHIDYVLRGGNREEWLIRRQNAVEQIPAWKPGEKLPDSYTEIPGNYILLMRLGDGSYHARAVNSDEVKRMPKSLQQIILDSEQGIEIDIKTPFYLIEDADSEFIEEASDGTWLKGEFSELVPTYMEMLAQELSGLPFDEPAAIGKLRPKLNQREVNEVEDKFRSISSILNHNGLPYIEKILPSLSPYDQFLEDEVFQYLSGDTDIQQLISDTADRDPNETHEIGDLTSIIVDPPERASLDFKARPPGVRVPQKLIDFQSRESRNKKLGRKGESYVIQVEKQRLTELGLAELTDRIEWVSETQGDGLGYDIRSFDIDGNDLYIEVKTTTMGIDFPFLVSANEVRVSEAIGSFYLIYRVFDFNNSPKIYILSGPISKSCQLVPMVFQARV